jgi:tRNA (mo5U34)-methyltransferase
MLRTRIVTEGGIVELADQTSTQAALQPPPAGFSASDFFKGVYWHQRWEVFKGVFSPGVNDVSYLWQAVGLPASLAGKRVLDVGAWHGCFSFECERRGAREVIAFSLEDPAQTGFDRLKQALDSNVQYVRGSAYTLAPEQLGSFDVILFFGVLYHLRYPLLAIDRLRSMCAGELFIETHTIDNYPWLRGPRNFFTRWLTGRKALKSTPIWRQYREFELAATDQSNWFSPNAAAVLEAFQSAGFTIEQTGAWGDRAGFRARVCPVPERLLKHTYESYPHNVDVVGLPADESARRF